MSSIIRRDAETGARWVLAAGIISLAICPIGASAQDTSETSELLLGAELRSAVERFVAPYEAAGAFNGVILIAEKDEILFEQGFGMANYELAVPNGPETRFRIGSISKGFTDAAVGLLVAQGKLTPATTLNSFYPAFPSAAQITIDLLMRHRSGIPNTNVLDWARPELRITLDGLIERLSREPLDFAPGTRRRYSNGGYAVLAGIIEKASGLSYGAFLRQNLLNPHGLDDTGHVGDLYKSVPRLATGYMPGLVPGTRNLARLYNQPLKTGGGSLYSTASDVYSFLRAALSGEILPAGLSAAMFGPADASGAVTGWGDGFFSQVYFDGGRDLFIVSLANNYAFPANWAQNLAAAASGQPPAGAPLSVSLDMTDFTVAKRLTGDYEWQAPLDGPIRLGLRDGYLIFEDREVDWAAALSRQPDGSYYNPVFDHICRFSDEAPAQLITCKNRAPGAGGPFTLRRADRP